MEKKEKKAKREKWIVIIFVGISASIVGAFLNGVGIWRLKLIYIIGVMFTFNYISKD